jgi:hypothetical protein
VAILGLDCKTYVNTGTYASPTWVLLDNIANETLNLSAGEAAADRRGGNGWKERLATLKDGSVDFSMNYQPGDANFDTLFDAFMGRDQLEFAFMDGPIATTGSEGLRATCQVFKFEIPRDLEVTVVCNIGVKPSPATNPPEWYEVGA